MSYEKFRRPIHAPYGVENPLQALTAASTGTNVVPYGITTITSASTAGSNIFKLTAPRRAGVRKTIVVDVGTTDAVDIMNAAAALSSAAGFFYGSSGQAVRVSTGNVMAYRSISLVSVSTSVWAISGLSTGVTVIGTTV